MKYEIVPLTSQVNGIIAELMRDSAVGDSFVISSGKEALVIKVFDILSYVRAQEQVKQAQVRINDIKPASTSSEPS